MPGRPPSLRAIAAFEAAARHQSFAKAADELNLTHGAISHAIRSLEDRLGSELFDRQGRGVALTEPGRVLAGRVRLGIGLLSDAFETRPWVERSKLVVSVLPGFATRVLVPRLERFRARHPDIELDIRANWSLAPVGEREIDIGLRYGPGGWASLSAVRLLDELVLGELAQVPRAVGRRLVQPVGELGGGHRPVDRQQLDDAHPHGMGDGGEGAGVAQAAGARHASKVLFRKGSCNRLLLCRRSPDIR